MMKKMISLIIILTFIFAACGTEDNSDNVLSNVSEMLDVEIPEAELINNIETHSGFHGDGITFVSMKLAGESFAGEISTKWNKLPLTENLTALVYGISDENTAVGPYITEAGKPLFPKAENGYYYFSDRHSESKDSANDTEVLDRHSMNFIIAIYDADNNTLHYCKFDS